MDDSVLELFRSIEPDLGRSMARILNRADLEDGLANLRLWLVKTEAKLSALDSDHCRAWMFVQARREAFRVLDAAKRQRQALSSAPSWTPRSIGSPSGDWRSEAAWEVVDSSETQQRSDDRLDLTRALAQLSDAERDSVILTIVEGQTDQEASAILGRARSTIAGNRRRALDKLRQSTYLCSEIPSP